MNSDKNYGLQAPYLTMERAKELLNPFMISKEVKTREIREIMTEKDVFLDVN